jgi:hypothetical protein
MEGLTDDARTLFKIVSRRSHLTADQEFCRTHKIKSIGDAARELEKRLLVQTEEVHTSTGAHAKRIQTWERWASEVSFDPERVTASEAKKKLEDVVMSLNDRFNANGRLPWPLTGR